MTKQSTLGVSIVFLIIIAIIGFLIIKSKNPPIQEVPSLQVVNFEDCVAAGYPVMESYPRQCRTSNGELFVENVDTSALNPTPVTPMPVAQGDCYVGGCSGEVCSDQKDAVSSCIYRSEYACYKTAECKRQPSGQCGWTDTPALAQCIAEASK